jgi:hypothetical protein
MAFLLDAYWGEALGWVARLRQAHRPNRVIALFATGIASPKTGETGSGWVHTEFTCGEDKKLSCCLLL